MVDPPDTLNARLRALGAAMRAPAVPVDVSGLRLLLKPEERSAEDLEWTRYLRALERDEHPTIRTSRWWCRSCSAFVREESAMCGKCRDRGPHVYGEQAPTTGNAQRRARLRADQQRRRKVRR